jgi:MFS transporter, SHS family, sialic acid transporter
VIAAVGTLQTAPLRDLLGGSLPRACSTLGLIKLIGVFIIWLGPETKGKPLPE